MTDVSQKWGRIGSSCWALPLSKYLSHGLCHHWLWILFAPVLRYKKIARMCQQDRFYTLEMRGQEHGRKIFHFVNASSSKFWSHCLHFRSWHSSAFLLLLLPSLVLIHLSALPKTKLSPCIDSQLSSFQEMLHHHHCSCKEQLGALCKKKEPWCLKPMDVFKKKDKTTYSNRSHISSRSV